MRIISLSVRVLTVQSGEQQASASIGGSPSVTRHHSESPVPRLARRVRVIDGILTWASRPRLGHVNPSTSIWEFSNTLCFRPVSVRIISAFIIRC